MEIPLGLVFQPHECDLIRFLFDLVTGGEVIDEALIHHDDVFGDKEPWELFSCYSSKKVAYFFTRLKRKSAAGSRVKRTVGKSGGNWHGQDRGKPVVDENGNVLMGHKRSFVYKNKKEPEQDGQWLLKEFYLPETIIKKAIAMHRSIEERKDFVLCRIERKKKGRDDDDDDDDQDNQETTSEQNQETTTSVQVPVPVETILPVESISYSPPTPNDQETTSEQGIGVPMPTTTTLQSTEVDEEEDDISSFFEGVLVEENADCDEFMEYAPHNQETCTSSIGIPEENNNNGCDYLWNMVVNMEDVTDLIDFD